MKNSNGTWLRSRMRRTAPSTPTTVAPAARALAAAAWLATPSAMGSEKGMPSSMMSTPAAAMATTSSTVASSDGSPAVR